MPRATELLVTTITRLKEALGPDRFKAAWEDGAGMSREDTYTLALNLLDDA